MMSFASPPPKSVGKSCAEVRVDLSKVSRSSSRVSRSILPDRVLQRRHRLVEVGRLRSRGRPCARAPWSSSSSAARLTAPSSAIAGVHARDLALQASRRRGAPRPRAASTPRRRPPRPAGSSNCSTLSCAACSLRRSSPTRSRSGATRASTCSRASSSSRSGRRAPRPRCAPRPASSRRRCALDRGCRGRCAQRRRRVVGELRRRAVAISASARSICGR